jgi:2-polyprenyl-6-hydroxyphenyl methylase/3-demethylubiquinone-9 3-methyltransferase
MLDHSSDPNFLAYYEQESLSEQTVGRFTRIRDRALALWSERNGRSELLDVVDIGCGAGTQAMLWAELGHRVRALDINEPLLQVGRERAKQRGLMVDFGLGTATALPYESASTDICLLPELLEHVADWESCVREAARILRPGAVLYLSTTNWLCPVQEEFNLPLYSWYPPALKRHFERLAVTTRPDLANHARYPAVHWFSFFQLRDHLIPLGFECLDRFDMLARQPISGLKRLVASLARSSEGTRLVAHVFSGGTTVWALKRSGTPTHL